MHRPSVDYHLASATSEIQRCPKFSELCSVSHFNHSSWATVYSLPVQYSVDNLLKLQRPTAATKNIPSGDTSNNGGFSVSDDHFHFLTMHPP